MHKSMRPIPYPDAASRAAAVAATARYLEQRCGLEHSEAMDKARAAVRLRNEIARNTPVRGERCGAKTRRGTACLCQALSSGRCRFHGGLSTGAKTPEGKARQRAGWRKQRGLDS